MIRHMNNVKKILDEEYKSYILLNDEEVLMSDDLSYQQILTYHTSLSAVILLIGIDYSYLNQSIEMAKECVAEDINGGNHETY